MTERNFEKELIHDYYYDMENGNDTETISYSALIRIITEFHNRIEALEKELEYQKEYAMEQNERYS
jgi:hypothetical protein